jgi:pyruvate/2-oxoglutarate dehydrogenase complex dihydrolipoamide acyltransferase (E2) component
MLHKIRLPKLAETTDVVVIDEWLVKVGDSVAVDQALASVETDKVTVELPTPVAGTVRELLIPANEEARTGDYVCTIEST